jgi:hypothetical protein
MSQSESAARTQHTRKARLKSLAARPALIALAAAGMIAGSAGMAAAAPSSSAHPGAPAAATGFSPGGPIHPAGAGSAAKLRGGISHQQAESTNWSGYEATTGTHASVTASWTQPAGICRSGDQYAAFWVGLDGANDSTVEQTGSEVDCVGQTAVYSAWYEMYPRGPEYYANTVRAGDHFRAKVGYLGNNRFTLQIQDDTQGWIHTTSATMAGTARSSAEVIVEAPGGDGVVQPLTDFGTVSFTDSVVNGSALSNAGGLTQVIMINDGFVPKDSVSSLNEENFSATWLSSS